ncbi:EAL domain-containing protein [Halospina sp. K52047b]|uniref:putative bifunctional diguanylate cyclase/phosphodiesterase n=1 Tax=Halospina sp. K52047b TaxID=2614160 RepID=UPI00124A7C48|nr:EAL domain-containing protein [Halospina sp. K52047b]KAA8983510.1 EAL domain-containing protein [Halospina sp. K52047b]
MALLPETGFRARLMLAMLALVVLASGSVAAVLMYNLFEEEKARAEEQLNVAERVAKEVIDARTDLLVSNLQILSRDFGLKSAIASRDIATITSALENHSSRANTDLAMIADDDGRLLANLADLDNGKPVPFSKLFQKAHQEGSVSAVTRWRNQVHQVLMVPIEGAGLKAWLIAGFRLDDDFAHLIADLTATDIVFQATGDHNRILGTSLPESELPSRAMASTPVAASGMRENNRFFMRSMDLESIGQPPAQVWLLKDRASALSRYYSLILEMAVVLAVVLAIASGVVLVTARTLGRPIFRLSRFAQALGEDRHAAPPEIRVPGEPRILLRSLLNMRSSILQHEQRIEHAATHDSLTGLPNWNWRAIKERLQRCLDSGEQASVIGINMPDIKTINEMLGFRFGDETLIATALRLNGVLLSPGNLGRTGGSQFVAILPHLEDDSLLERLTWLKQRIETSVEVFGSPVQIHVDLAALRIPEQAGTIDEVQRRLDLTLERAPHTTNHIALYTPGGDEEHLREIQLIRDLNDAIQNRQLHLNYQPKLALDTGGFVGVEALVRWHHPELGFIGPDEFIPLAESSGQTLQLTELVMAMAAEDSRDWQGRGMDLKLAINLSALDLADPGLPEKVHYHFRHLEGEMHRLTFEITESAVMSDTGVALQTLEKLRALGANISVDDFGTGQSSLAQLRQLPVQELKIDKSFVLNMSHEEQDQLIVKSTIDLAHGLQLRVCAEGIENHESWRLLQKWGCEQAQGFFMGRPMAGADLPDWAARYEQWAREQGLDKSGDPP